MIVADASVVVDLLLGAGSEAGDDLARRLADREHLCAPHLLDIEVGQVLRRFGMRNELTDSQATMLVRDLVDLPIRRYPHSRLLPRAFEFRKNVTLYDGIYLALAEALDVPLVTGDAALRDVPGCVATVQIFATSKS